MSNINLDALIEQRAEATGSNEGRIPFDFKGQTYDFQDPLTPVSYTHLTLPTILLV